MSRAQADHFESVIREIDARYLRRVDDAGDTGGQ